MNIFNKVALEGMKKSRARTLVTVIGVVLSAAMITAVATFGVSLLDYMARGAALKYGSWDVEFEDADASFAAQQASNNAVASVATFQNIGYAKLDGAKNPKKPYLFIAGFSESAFDALPITLLSGRLPKNSGEILISGSVLAKGGVQFKAGDTVTLAVGNRMNGSEKLGEGDPYTAGETLVPRGERTYTVVGIFQTPHFEDDSAPGYTVITAADATDTADDLSLFVTLKNPREVHAYAQSAAAGRAYLLNNDVLRFMGLSDDPGDAIFTGLLYSVGGIVIAIIMIGSIFLIYNSFNISLNERTREFGILSSVGATARQLRRMVLFEGLCIGAIGIPIGVLIGIGAIGLVISVVAKNFGDILYSGVPLTVTISLPAIALAAIVSLITILISAYIPARKAAGTPVMESIRGSNEVKVEAKAVKTSKLAERLYGLEGTLALKNFKRNKKRYRSIVMSLVLSIVLFVSASAFVTDLKQVSQQAKAVTNYDIGFGTQDMDDSRMVQLYDQLKTAAGVYQSSYQADMTYSCIVETDTLSDAYGESAGVRSTGETTALPATIQFLDDAAYRTIIAGLDLSADEYTGHDAKLIAVAKMKGGSNRQEGVGDLSDVFKSSSVRCALAPQKNGTPETSYEQDVNVTLVDTVPPDTPPMTGTAEARPYTFIVMAPYSLKEKLAPSDAAADVVVKGMTFKSKDPAQSLSQMQTMIESAGIPSAYILLNMSDILDQNRNMIFIVNVFAYTFIVMISLIAAANVFNTISTNIHLRRRELAMLRSVGMSDRDFNAMMRFECAFYGMRALVVGLPLALISSWLIYYGMVIGGGDGIAFVLPWGSIAISVLSVLLVIFVTMMYAVREIKKENIIDALRDDMA